MSPKELRMLRLALGVSVGEFAILLNTERNTVTKWERGEAEATPEQIKQAVILARNARIQRHLSTALKAG